MALEETFLTLGYCLSYGEISHGRCTGLGAQCGKGGHMNQVVALPLFRTRDRDLEDNGAEYIKTLQHPKLISLRSEYEFYLRKFKRVYRIELSRTTKRWVLTFDDGTWGWDQRGWYIKTLCACVSHHEHQGLFRALELAEKFVPGEAAFFYSDGMEWRSNDPEFDEWFKGLDLFKEMQT